MCCHFDPSRQFWSLLWCKFCHSCTVPAKTEHFRSRTSKTGEVKQGRRKQGIVWECLLENRRHSQRRICKEEAWWRRSSHLRAPVSDRHSHRRLCLQEMKHTQFVNCGNLMWVELGFVFKSGKLKNLKRGGWEMYMLRRPRPGRRRLWLDEHSDHRRWRRRGGRGREGGRRKAFFFGRIWSEREVRGGRCFYRCLMPMVEYRWNNDRFFGFLKFFFNQLIY